LGGFYDGFVEPEAEVSDIEFGVGYFDKKFIAPSEQMIYTLFKLPQFLLRNP